MFARVEQLAPLPEIATTVMKVVDDPKTTTKEIAEAIAYDPVMAGRVLRTSNTPFFCRSSPVTTIEDACRRLGLNTVRNIVIASSMIGSSNHGTAPPPGFWAHSLTVSFAAIHASALLGMRHLAEPLFLSGLMHDLGHLVVGPLGAGSFTDDAARLDAERRNLETDHAEIGGEIAAMWNLPAHVVETARFNHDPDKASEFCDLVSLVHVIDGLDRMYRDGVDADDELSKGLSEFAIDTIAADRRTLHTLYTSLPSVHAEVESLHAALG